MPNDSTTAPLPADESAAPARRLGRRPGQVLACGWCGGPVQVRARGRTPKWCSSTCRDRAWEQSRAADSGRSAVQVVDRQVEVEVPVPVTRVELVEVPVALRGPGWVSALADLAVQLDTGRIYDRDLDSLGVTLDLVVEAYHRRATRTRHRK